jgi:lipid-binding SYLF domain-containing protein
MYRTLRFLLIPLLLVILGGSHLRAGRSELTTVDKAIEVVRANAALPLKGISPAALRGAQGVAIIPHVVKAGFLFDHESGHGLVLARRPDGSWSDPVFVTIEGGGVGLEAGVEAIDLVLVFKSASSMERILKGKGKLTFGTDLSVAAGPIGRDAEMASDKFLKTDVLAYSRSRGLFAGLALDGAKLYADGKANEGFYKVPGLRPEEVMTRRFAPVAAVETLKAELNRLSGIPMVVPAPVFIPH